MTTVCNGRYKGVEHKNSPNSKMKLQGFGRNDLTQNKETKQWEMITIRDPRFSTFVVMIMILFVLFVKYANTQERTFFSVYSDIKPDLKTYEYSDIRVVVGRTEQEAFDEEFLPLGLMTWNVLNDTCVDLNDNQANIVMSSTSSDNATFLSDSSPIIGYPCH